MDYLTSLLYWQNSCPRARTVRRGFPQWQRKTRYADLRSDRHRRRASRGQEIIPLTTKEFALLELFCSALPNW